MQASQQKSCLGCSQHANHANFLPIVRSRRSVRCNAASSSTGPFFVPSKRAPWVAKPLITTFEQQLQQSQQGRRASAASTTAPEAAPAEAPEYVVVNFYHLVDVENPQEVRGLHLGTSAAGAEHEAGGCAVRGTSLGTGDSSSRVCTSLQQHAALSLLYSVDRHLAAGACRWWRSTSAGCRRMAWTSAAASTYPSRWAGQNQHTSSLAPLLKISANSCGKPADGQAGQLTRSTSPWGLGGRR